MHCLTNPWYEIISSTAIRSSERKEYILFRKGIWRKHIIKYFVGLEIRWFHFYTFPFSYFCVCMCMCFICVGTHIMLRMWLSGDTLQELALSLHHERLNSSCQAYREMSSPVKHLASPSYYAYHFWHTHNRFFPFISLVEHCSFCVGAGTCEQFSAVVYFGFWDWNFQLDLGFTY